MRCTSIFGPLAYLRVPSGLDAASTGRGKASLSFRFVGIH